MVSTDAPDSTVRAPGTTNPSEDRAVRPIADTDRELARRCVAREEEACRQLYRRLLPRVRSAIYRVMGPGRDNEDLSQETMLEIWKSLPRFRGDARLETWATRVAINVTLQHLRRRRRRVSELPLEPERVDSAEPGPATVTERRKLVERIQNLLLGLTENKREAFVLHELGGLTTSEVAGLTGVPVSTAKSRIWYARKELSAAARRDPVLRDYLEAGDKDPVAAGVNDE